MATEQNLVTKELDSEAKSRPLRKQGSAIDAAWSGVLSDASGALELGGSPQASLSGVRHR